MLSSFRGDKHEFCLLLPEKYSFKSLKINAQINLVVIKLK